MQNPKFVVSRITSEGEQVNVEVQLSKGDDFSPVVKCLAFLDEREKEMFSRKKEAEAAALKEAEARVAAASAASKVDESNK